METKGAVMANETTGEMALVTGGSGFLAGWMIAALLNAGYRVRTTVRNLAREGEVRAALSAVTQGGERLEFLEADLLNDHGWDRAAAGAAYVLHVASPMQVGEFRNQDVIRPAREGTLRVLKAAAAAGVRRTVITSSAQAALPRRPGDDPSDETAWTDLSARRLSDYTRAKTLAEQDAWRFAAENTGMSVATVLPAFIQGPVLSADISGSIEIISRLLKGQVSAVPRLGFTIVDVRDLAALHLSAMTAPEAHGQRFIGGGDFLWFSDIARLLRQTLGKSADRVPTKVAPDFLIRLAALSQKELRQLTPTLGKRYLFSSAKAERLLGWKSRPAATSVLDAAQSLIRTGLT